MCIPTDELSERVFSRNPKERKRLREKHLVIVGLGSVGSALALMAARAGIGRFTLIDVDMLEPENVCRHFCDLGAVKRLKVEAVAELIRRVNPAASVETLAADFREIDRTALLPELNSHTLLIGATDSFECQSLLNMLSLETQTPALYVGCWGEAVIGEILYVIPGKTPCFECYAAFRRQTEELSLRDPRKYTDLGFDQTKVPGQAGLWPNILIICGYAFQLILAVAGADEKRSHELLDFSQTLFLINVADFESVLPLWSVTPGTVQRGCALCDEKRIAELALEIG
jgi:hypothetical protein